MPFQPEHSLLRVEVPCFRTIDTTSVENLYGMWSVFSKTSHATEYGKRLENLSWRLWNREALCCVPPNVSRPASRACDIPMPALSSSLDSSASDDLPTLGDRSCSKSSSTTPPRARPELRRLDSTDSMRPKHITPDDLEKMVISIKETDFLEPIELPTVQISCSEPAHAKTPPPAPATRPSQARPTPTTSVSRANLESSASTIYTSTSQKSESLQTNGSDQTTATEVSTHSIIRGFTPGGASSSYRSQTNLTTQPAPILKTSPSYHQIPQPKKKAAMFTIGTSSDDDNESSLESRVKKTLPENIKRPSSLHSYQSKKQTSFPSENAIVQAVHHSPVFESDDEDEEVSESAIEDDDDSSDWEDSDDGSGSSSINDRELFQRVDSRPNLTSRRSLLTSLMHEPDRAEALAKAASRSTPAMRRSRTSSPNGPSFATSPDSAAQMLRHEQDIPRSKPIMMTTSASHHQLALSPRTTRKNMLSTELTESLRMNLLWERQHRSTGNLAALKRRHTSHDVKNLRQHPEPGPVLSHQDRSIFNNDYFHAGLGQYHEKGW